MKMNDGIGKVVKRFCPVAILTLSLLSYGQAEDAVEKLLKQSSVQRKERNSSAEKLRAEEGIEPGAWYGIGPFKDMPFGNLLRGFRHAFEVEKDVLAGGIPDFSKTYTTVQAPAELSLERSWDERPEWADGYRHWLPRGPKPSRNETTYLFRTIKARRATTKTMRLYAEDFLGAWLNGRKLGEACRHYGPHRGPIPLVVSLPLKAGENHLFIKITSMWGRHGFSFGIDGVTPSNRQLPRTLSPEVLGPYARLRAIDKEWNMSNFYPGDEPYVARGGVASAAEDHRATIERLAGMFGLPPENIGALAPEDDPDAVKRLDDLANALRRIKSFRFELEMVPLYDPPRSEMYEMLLTRYPPTAAAKRHQDDLVRLRVQAGKALALFEAGEPEAVGALREAAASIEAMWVDRIRSLPPIVFLRTPMFTHNAVAPYDTPGKKGGSICVFDPSRPDQPPRVIFHEPRTAIFDMNLSFDAKTVFFSARRPGVEGSWHLYEIGVDGRHLKQITFGKCADISPVELPDGRIMFVSTRIGTFVQCQPREAGLLFTCNRDGSGLRAVSANIDSDHSPQVMNDGRVLFTRWDYGVEKHVFARHALWTMNPDGTGLQLFAGNTVEDPAGFWEARPIPGRPEVVCAFGPHHTHHAGMAGLVWDKLGPEAPRGAGFRFITNEMPSICDTSWVEGYQDLFPLHEKLFLASYGGDGRLIMRIYLLDDLGNRKCIFEAANALSCLNPIPLRPRSRPPIIAPKTDNPEWVFRDPEEMNTNPQNTPTGTFLVQDVYRGLEPHIKRGEVTHIRVMEQVQKSRSMACGDMWGVDPVVGKPTVHVKRVYGLVPVEADGSACFEAPALKSIYLDLLDKDGKMLMQMGSDMHVMPGEKRSCVGCHEIRESDMAPLAENSPVLAMRKEPVKPLQPEWGTEGIVDYQQVVQPVLDKYCIDCHGGPNPKGNMDLSGDRTRVFCMSYDNLVDRDLIDYVPAMASGHDENTPLAIGSLNSRICGHIDTPEHSGKLIPLEDRQRVYSWIDANAPYYGTYHYTKPRGIGTRDAWGNLRGNNSTVRPSEEIKRIDKVFDRRCLSCHSRKINNQGFWGYLRGPMTRMVDVTSSLWTDRGTTAHVFPERYPYTAKLGPELRMNMTHPKHSAMLQAPLSAQAGGWGICVQENGAGVFEDVNDPDYRVILSMLNIMRDRLYAEPRVDMSPEHVRGIRALIESKGETEPARER